MKYLWMILAVLILMTLTSSLSLAWEITSAWRFEMDSTSNATYNFGATVNVVNVSGTNALITSTTTDNFVFYIIGSEPFNVTINQFNSSLLNFTVASGLSSISYNLSVVTASSSFNFKVDTVQDAVVNSDIAGTLIHTSTSLGASVLHEFILATFTTGCTARLSNGNSCLNSQVVAENITTVNVSSGDCIVECTMLSLNFSGQVNTTAFDRCNYAITNGSLYNPSDEGCSLTFHTMNLTDNLQTCFANVTANDVSDSCTFVFEEDLGLAQASMPELTDFNVTDIIVYYNVTVVDE